MKEEDYQQVKAFDEGMSAWEESRSKSDCPYDIDTKQRQEWLKGYEVMELSGDRESDAD